jgi:hypothetical protein
MPGRLGSERAVLRIVAGCAYVAAFAVLAVLERDGNYSPWAGYFLGILCLGLGVAVGKWWSLLIPALLLLILSPFYGLGDALSAGTAFVAITALGVGLRLAIAQTSRDYRDIDQRTVLVVAAYVTAVGILFAYAATLDVEDSVLAGTVAFLVLQVLVGLALGRWRALLLVALLPILAIPVPTPEDAYEPLPLWFGMLIFAPLIAALIAAGVGARKVWNRLRSPAVA